MSWQRVLGAVALVVGVLEANQVMAAPITYDLTCLIGGLATPSCGQPSYGTVTISDNATDANKVDVTVNLVDTGGTAEKVLEVFLNYDDFKFSNSTAFVVTGNITSYSVDENNQKADGYTGGDFDIQLPKTGNGGFEPVTFTIALASTNLNPSDFNFKDSGGYLYDAVHIGACGPDTGTCTPGTSGTNSIWVGSGVGGSSAPEPMTLGLLGAGLVGLGLLRRRRA